MKALVVVESMLGNTAAIADAIAETLRCEAVTAQSVRGIPLGIDLVVIGAPTHNMKLPSPKSRVQSEKSSGRTAPMRGVAELIDELEPTSARFVTFDTAVKGGTRFGSAAKAAAKKLKKRSFAVEVGESFLIRGTTLVDGELDRAREWAGTLRG